MKVLMVATQEILEICNDGGKKISYRNYRLLKDIFGDENVYLCMLTNHVSEKKEERIFRYPAYKNSMERMFNILGGSIFTGKRYVKKIVDFIEKQSIDVLFIDRMVMGDLAFLVKKKIPGVRIIGFSHNIEKEYFANKLKNSITRFLICPKVKKSELLTYRYSNLIIALTKRDSDKMKKEFGKAADFIIPTSFEDSYDKSYKATEKEDVFNLLFVGSDFGPNYDGIKWFINNVMPRLNGCRLTVVGKGFEKRKAEFESESVEVVGTVDDTSVYYYRNNVMVMPIFYGDGQKVKTGEAMMYGKIVIGTGEAFEGYDVSDTKGLIKAETVEEYVDAINRLKSDADLSDYEESVRQLFSEKYSYNAILKSAGACIKKESSKRSLDLIEYQGRKDEKGSAVGHAPKVLKEYTEAVSETFLVRAYAPSCVLKSQPKNIISISRQLDKDIVMKSGNTFFEKIANKLHMFHNIKRALEDSSAEAVWFFNVEYYFFLYMALRKKVNKKIIVTMFTDGFKGSKIQDFKMKVFEKAQKKLDLIISTGEDYSFKNCKSIFIPDYDYEPEKYDRYRSVQKKAQAVCLGTMGKGKELKEMTEAFTRIGYPLVVAGRFYDKAELAKLSANAGTNVTFIDEYISDKRYLELLSESTYCVLPYGKHTYDTKTSGVMQEAVFADTIPVSYSTVLEGNHVDGIGFESWEQLDSASLSGDNAMILASFETLRNKKYNKNINREKYISCIRNVICDAEE